MTTPASYAFLFPGQGSQAPGMGKSLFDPETIRRNLIEQVTGRVRWVESVRTMKALGIAAALEVGPGKVLAGLVKRIEPTLEVSPAGTAEDIGQVAGK